MTEIEEYFLDITNDLELRIESGSKYDLIESADLLRKLLFDKHSLIDQINRTYRYKLQFVVKYWPDTEPEYGKIQLQTVVPNINDETKIVNKDNFLSTKCLFIFDKSLTVKDILDHVAYVRGGVHTPKPPTKEKDKYLSDEVMRILKFGFSGSEAVDMGIGLIKPIARVTLNAIDPLIALIKTDK